MPSCPCPLLFAESAQPPSTVPWLLLMLLLVHQPFICAGPYRLQQLVDLALLRSQQVSATDCLPACVLLPAFSLAELPLVMVSLVICQGLVELPLGMVSLVICLSR